MKHTIKKTNDFHLSYEEMDIEGYKKLPSIHCDIYTKYTPTMKRQLKDTIDRFGEHWAVADLYNDKQNRFIQSFGYIPVEIMEDLTGSECGLYYYGGSDG